MSIAKRNFNDELNKFIDEFISKNKESKILHIPPEFKSKGNLAPNPPKPVQKKKKGLWGLLKTPIKDLLPSSEVLNDKEKENNIKKTLSFKDYHKSIYPNDEILMYIDPYFIFTKHKIYFLIYEGNDESAEKIVKSLKSGISYREISSINFQRWKKKDKIYDFGLGVFFSILCAALCYSFIITELTSNTNIIWWGALFGLLAGIQKDKPAMIFTKKSATKNESHTLDQFSHSNLSFNLFEKFRSEFLIFFNEYQKEENDRIINEQKQKEKRLAEEEKRKAAEEKRKAAEEKRRIEQSDKLRIKEYNDSLQQIVEKINKAGSPEKIEENILNSLLKANEISIASKDKEYSNAFSLKFVRLSNFLKIQRENLIETYLSIKNNKLKDKDFKTAEQDVFARARLNEHTIEHMQSGANIVETLNAIRKRRGGELLDRASEEELVFGTGVFTEEDKEEIVKNKVESNIEKAEMLALDIIRYHTLHFKSVEMIALLIEDKKIDFYRLYEVFDQLNVFDSKFQKDNLEKLDSLKESNKELMEKLTEELGAVGTSVTVAIKQMQSNLSDSSRAVERTIRNSSNQISQSVDNNTQIVDKQLKKVNNKLFWNNIISGFNAYQNFRINKKLK